MSGPLCDLRPGMSSKALRRQADELLRQGWSRQQAFDMLQADNPRVKPKRLAETLRNLPTMADRQRYQSTLNGMLAVMVLYAVLSVVHEFHGREFSWMGNTRYLMLVPVATILLGWSVYRWQGQVFRWVGWVNLLGAVSLIGAYTALFNGTGDPWRVVLDTLSVIIGGLALFLAVKVFPKYRTERRPVEQGGVAYVFPEGGQYF